MKGSSFKLYSLLLLFICGWWCVAFRETPVGDPVDTSPRPELPNKEVLFLSELSSFDREELHKALSGDISLMVKLIADWDLDAQIIDKRGLAAAERLPEESFLRAQVLGRQLLNSSSQQLAVLQEQAGLKHIRDDTGTQITLQKPLQRFLPQTFVAASFLLALSDPEEIVAIPGGVRHQTQLYPAALTEQIPLDIDRYNGEKVFQASPELAFVAHYSHPSTIQALKDQGIGLFTLKSINSITEIQNALRRVSHVINRPMEGELLTLFIDSAISAIDTRLALHHALSNDTPDRSLFLNHHVRYSVPTTKTLTGQLLAKMGVTLPSLMDNKEAWMVPIDLEEIVNFNPECLIIASSNGPAALEELKSHPAFASLPALQQEHIYFVDQDTQFSPSQYVVLAYYDLAKAVTGELL